MSSIEIFPWNTNFETGIGLVDEQHRVLVGLLNGLAEHLVYQMHDVSFSSVFEELQAYALFHFDAEEKIWQQHFAGDTWLRWHQKSHHDFIDGIAGLIADHATSSYDDVLEKVIKFLTHWLAFHILESDRRMAKAILLLPGAGSLEKAKELANHEMTGSARILIDTILTMYDKLANSTVKMSREIYKRRLIEAELRQAKERAQAATNAKSNLLATISHEIRTPLSAISTMIYMLRRGRVSKANKEYLANIELATKHVLGVLNNVLDLSKMEANKLELAERDVDLAAIFRNVTALIADRAREKSLDIAMPPLERMPALVGDATRIQQALLNYADNAVKFTTSGRVGFSLRILEEDPASVHLCFVVEDTGIGIAPESIGKLFGKFEQAEHATPQERAGTGLGLEITKRLAEQMGGSVGVDSRLGFGSTFWFSVRLRKGRQAPVPRGPAARARRKARAPDERFAGRKVLVVDDDDVTRIMLERFLRGLGFAATTAASGDAALGLARRRHFDLVLMDLQMPQMDGLEAARRLRGLDRTRTTPIVALTGDVDTYGKEQCLQAGMNDFVHKPFDPNAFIALLSDVLRPGAREDGV